MIHQRQPTVKHAPDSRFSDLLGPAAWARLPDAVRRRFGKCLSGGESMTYKGQVTAMTMSRAGWLLANAARLIGAPLPYDAGSLGLPAVVVVTEDIASNGQFWIRQYGRRNGFPQVVHSSKRFAGPTGLEEYVGFGIGMALTLEARPDALLFRSDHYFVQVAGLRIRLPRALSPGSLTIGHHDLGRGRFRFSLRLEHPRLGVLIHQDALFSDPKE